MKIQTLVMGDYGSPPVRFCLYLFPTPLTPPLSTTPEQQTQPQLQRQHHRYDHHHHQDKKHPDTSNSRFLCLEDLEILFFRHNDDAGAAKRELDKVYYEHPSWFCTDQAGGRSYVMTRAAAHVANQLAIDTLADLCSFTENDLCSGHADDLLRRITDLRPITVSVTEQEFIPVRLVDGETRFCTQQTAATITTNATPTTIIRFSPPSETTIRFDPCRDDVSQ
ncbi:hypothetical protein BX666DRAFT_2025660 [Dichotomocladium elegans]|nr:hypothetical protein BX666DRAFT_2025660 [Dichotomocladium elegans]